MLSEPSPTASSTWPPAPGTVERSETVAPASALFLPSLTIFLTFGRVGMFSFGGGAASQLLLRKELVWKHHWLDDAEYNRIWQLSKLSLGIQLIAQVIIFGRRLGGPKGILAAVAGFILPSVLLTVGLSIVLVAIIGNRLVEDALRVVIPLTGGMTMATALQMWNPKMPGNVRQSWRVLGEGALVVTSAILVGIVHVPVPVVMLGAIVGGALLPA